MTRLNEVYRTILSIFIYLYFKALRSFMRTLTFIFIISLSCGKLSAH